MTEWVRESNHSLEKFSDVRGLQRKPGRRSGHGIARKAIANVYNVRGHEHESASVRLNLAGGAVGGLEEPGRDSLADAGTKPLLQDSDVCADCRVARRDREHLGRRCGPGGPMDRPDRAVIRLVADREDASVGGAVGIQCI